MPNTDFFIINFKTESYEPEVSACYAQITGGKPQLWSDVISNSFYDRTCGQDKTDYLNNSKYKKQSEAGVGIGTQINY